ncbi:ApbE family lipoprotein [Methanosalsum zhilinae DSM 4017]|uniref:UPF0280 protein Mzhil_0896 n=1 Tax=Methanosalsum zhilinae (strain DSM 4017 / NBRC 107636 / OCM 62 / WeN5) TaxID=679901 RepID=F7XLA1_METZD|nr:UPF0280 family protein [Methanosalsum zhilinae]AEH60758.1 ApbE family lipoprotein [Methanosalsum zhilinae DSM 4017]
MKEYFQIKETAVTIIADERSHIDAAKKAIISHRDLLERFIYSEPYFKIAMEPYDVPENAPEIVKRLAEAGNIMSIGPMSAIAGTISSLAVESMIDEGATYAIVDNGGDIALVNDREVVIGVYAGQSQFKNLAFLIPPKDKITGVCTSSGTVGPSISFGFADAAIVFSDNVSLADSAATALGNSTDINSENIETAFEVLNVPNIEGAVLIQDDKMGIYGQVPEIVKADIKYDCITKA